MMKKIFLALALFSGTLAFGQQKQTHRAVSPKKSAIKRLGPPPPPPAVPRVVTPPAPHAEVTPPPPPPPPPKLKSETPAAPVRPPAPPKKETGIV